MSGRGAPAVSRAAVGRNRPACDPDYGGRHRWADRRGLDSLDVGLPAEVLVERRRCVFCSAVEVRTYLGRDRAGAVVGYESAPALVYGPSLFEVAWVACPVEGCAFVARPDGITSAPAVLADHRRVDLAAVLL